MKKIILVITLLSCAYCIFQFVRTANKTPPLNSEVSIFFPTPLPTQGVKSSTVVWNGIAYAYEYFEVTDISKLSLLANFTEKKASEILIKEKGCQYAINGGFYNTNDKPLGQFLNPTMETSSIKSSLVNGYISIASTPDISFTAIDNSVIAVQTGPMLMADGKKLILAIKNDEHARRMIAGISSRGTLVFMSIFIPETVLQGPQLADLPNVIEQISIKLSYPIVSAVNLDGGNASVFKNNNVYLEEFTHAGSLFCLQK
jgi:hypothetical protein